MQMPTIKPIAMAARSNPDRDSGAARLINCYAESAGEEGKVASPVYACDGFNAFSTLTGSGSGAVRGMLNLDDTTLYVVTGQRINRVSTAGAATDMGALATTGVAYMARNRKATTQIGIVTSDGLFRIIESNAVSTPSLAGSIPTFNSLCALDGYFIFTAANGEWFISAIDEGATIDELDFAKASSSPDGAVRGLVRGRDVMICGPRSTEFYQNTGATDFPFERTTATNIGVYAPASMVNLAAGIDGNTVDTVAWAATNADGAFSGVMLLDGYQGKKISPPRLDRLIRAYATPAAIRGFTYTASGHTFYCITGFGATWEYNATTGQWHERKSTGLDYWRVTDACYFNGSTVFGDASSAALYRSAAEITPLGASTVALRHSRDLGSSWISRTAKSIGGSTAMTRRVAWNRLGQSHKDGLTLELTMSNALVEAGVATDAIMVPPTLHAGTRPVRLFRLAVDVTSGASETTRAKGFRGLGAIMKVLDG